MVDDTLPLAMAYASSRPAEVAELLGEQPLHDVLDFLEALPPASAGAVMARMPTRQVENCLVELSKSFLATILTTCEHHDAISLVSHMEEHSYDPILDSASEAQKPALARMFAFPKRTLSAIASPGFLRVHQDQDCTQVKEEIERLNSDEPLLIVVCDEDGRYQGILTLEQVVASRHAGESVRAVMQQVAALSGQTLIATALEAPQWHRFMQLPVVDEAQHILGSVSFEQLHSLAQDHEKANYGVSNLLEDTTVRYFNFCADILGILAGNRSR